MHHKDVKEKLFKNPKVKKEYDDLEISYNIKKQIIKLRQEKGLSQKELAKLIGTRQSAISRLESENSNPSIRFLNKVAKALDKNLEIKFR